MSYPRHLLKCIVSAVVLLTCNLVSAEILHGVFPFDTLKVIKAKYPNARFERVNAAWVTENQAFFKMTGNGFPGTLFVAFGDARPSHKKDFAEKCMFPAQTVDAICTVKKRLSEETDDDALSTSWVRWIPQAAIPLDRYKSKYGEPTFEFAQDTMAPYASWKSVALLAGLSDDKKFVLAVETSFSRAELHAAWVREAGVVPNFLKDEPTPSERTKTPAKKRL
jgi:hypothetical protein